MASFSSVVSASDSAVAHNADRPRPIRSDFNDGPRPKTGLECGSSDTRLAGRLMVCESDSGWPRLVACLAVLLHPFLGPLEQGWRQ